MLFQEMLNFNFISQRIYAVIENVIKQTTLLLCLLLHGGCSMLILFCFSFFQNAIITFVNIYTCC